MEPQPFTSSEHQKFLEGLQKLENSDSIENVWSTIAEHVGTRNAQEIQFHAYRYFLILHAHAPREVIEEGMSSVVEKDVSSWTVEEEAIFEASLAFIPETDPMRFQKISKLISNRSHNEIVSKFNCLFADVSRIQLGEVVIMR